MPSNSSSSSFAIRLPPCVYLARVAGSVTGFVATRLVGAHEADRRDIVRIGRDRRGVSLPIAARLTLMAVLVAPLLAAVVIAALRLAVAALAAVVAAIASRVLLRAVMLGGGPLGGLRVRTAIGDVELDLDQLL